MGAVYIGFQRGAAGFVRTVAIKRAHPHVLADAHSRAMILEEARHASLVRHPNVVSVDDVEEVEGELLLVMNYVEGASLSQLLGSDVLMPRNVALRIAIDVCTALEAIHTAKSEAGGPLALVHRDVSPQNVLVGVDGLARVTDFGIAKGVRGPKRTSLSMRRGKIGYMSPEYLRTGATSASSDMFAFGVVVWEMLARRRLFKGDSDVASIDLTLTHSVPRLSTIVAGVPPLLDVVVGKALANAKIDRFASMQSLRVALEGAAHGIIASREEVTAYVRAVAGAGIDEVRGELRAAKHQLESEKPVAPVVLAIVNATPAPPKGPPPLPKLVAPKLTPPAPAVTAPAALASGPRVRAPRFESQYSIVDPG